MKTPSQTSYASRLARAEQLHQFISSFQDYNPGIPELSPAGFQIFIMQLSATQSEHTIKHFDYAEAAKERRKVFITNPYSISKSLTMVNAFVKAKNGKDSQQFLSVYALVKKIRGERPVTITRNSNEETISRSEKSYGSQLQNFTDIITLLHEYGQEYMPSNTMIGLLQLETLKGEASVLNNTVNVTYSAYKPKINQRQQGFKELNDIANRIKEMVKAQYGTNSVEYKLISGLDFRI